MTKQQKVLVVDASKLVRISLAKCLKGHFEVVEDADGESAWQTLVLDNSVIAVIAASNLAVLDGIGLVERMRDSRLCRLNRMPFFMLVSDSFSGAERQDARAHGVSGFVPKGMDGAEIIAMIRRFAEQLPLMPGQAANQSGNAPVELAFNAERSLIGASDIMGQVGQLEGMAPASGDGKAAEKPSEKKGEHARKVREFLGREDLSARLRDVLAANPSGPLGLLVFGLDGYADLVERHGKELAERITQKIGKMLAAKIKREDSIAYPAPGRVAILAPDTDSAACAKFAQRVSKALAAAQISLRGQPLGMTLSVGIAVLPEDAGAMQGLDLLALAASRLEAAQRAGGNRIQAGGVVNSVTATATPQEFLARLHGVMESAGSDVLANCLAHAGLQILPLLVRIEHAWSLGLPLDELESRLIEQAQKEPLAG